MRLTSNTMIALAAAAVALAAAPPLGQLKLAPESNVWVSGKSTVKDFRCVAKTLDANVVAPAGETAAMEIGKLVSAADIAIKVEQLDCGNGTMNEHMRKALNIKVNPRIEFKMTSYEIANGAVSVKGALTMNGQSHAVELLGKAIGEDGLVRSTATQQINMTAWGVKPPSLMMGTMKVKPLATIGYDIVIKR